MAAIHWEAFEGACAIKRATAITTVLRQDAPITLSLPDKCAVAEPETGENFTIATRWHQRAITT